MSAPVTLHARAAWLPCAEERAAAGWVRDVRVAVDDRGHIESVAVGVTPQHGDVLLQALLPGVPNLHSHSFQRAIIGRTERSGPAGEDFWTWRTQMYRTALSLTPEALEALAYRSFVEMLEAGYTSVCEFHYLHQDGAGQAYADPAELSLRIAAAAQRAGIRLCLLPVLYQHAGFGRLPPRADQRRFVLEFDAYLRLVESLRARELNVGIAPHSLRAVDVATLRQLGAWRQSVDAAMPLHIHVAEQTGELDECRAHTGFTPIELLCETLALDAACCLVHATHPTERELQRIGAAGATIALCPTTEANLGDGIFPLRTAQAAGVRFGVGSDSQVSRSPWPELRLLEYSQRLNSRRRCVAAGPGQSTGAVLFAAAVEHKSAVTGFAAEGIKVGGIADFIGIDQATMEAIAAASVATEAELIDELLDTLIFDESAARTLDVYVGGRRVVAQGRHISR